MLRMAKKIESNTRGKGEYKELIDFLSVKFDKIDERFDVVEQKLDQKADKIEIQQMFGGVNDRITRLADKIDGYRAGQIGMQKQIDKHEKWHFRTAAKIGLDLLAEK